MDVNYQTISFFTIAIVILFFLLNHGHNKFKSKKEITKIKEQSIFYKNIQKKILTFFPKDKVKYCHDESQNGECIFIHTENNVNTRLVVTFPDKIKFYPSKGRPYYGSFELNSTDRNKGLTEVITDFLDGKLSMPAELPGHR